MCFLTDGYIGNEAEILAAIQKRLGATRIFSFGIGSSVNRYLMERMAKVGRGAVACLGPNDSAARLVVRLPRVRWDRGDVTSGVPLDAALLGDRSPKQGRR